MQNDRLSMTAIKYSNELKFAHGRVRVRVRPAVCIAPVCLCIRPAVCIASIKVKCGLHD